MKGKTGKRKALERRAQRIQGRICDSCKDPERLSAVYREMSNLDPAAFVVVVEHHHDGNKATVHGLSHNVSRGIETNWLHFDLERSFREGEKDYLLFRVEEEGCAKCSPRIMIMLESGQASTVFLGRGSFPARVDVFFSLDRKEARAFAKAHSKPRPKKK
jgi:hypothetical protein